MNTTSLLLNGRTAADIALLPERQPASLTTLYSRPSSPRTMLTSSPSPLSTRLSSTMPIPRPPHKRSPPSRDSPGWYNTEDGMTLDDFARRLNSLLGRFEQWQGRCAQNVVMALFSPTPVVLFLLNPVALLIWIVMGVWWLSQ